MGKPNNLTGAEMTVGTVNYAAPEQLKGDEIDGRADQYALAATTYHLLTGSAPFTDTNPAIVISQHLSAPPPAIGTGRPDLSRFGPVFAKALAKDPADRFDTCRDFAVALQKALDSPAARHRVSERPAHRRRRVAVGLAALLVGGVAAAVLVLLPRMQGSHSRSTPTTPPPPAVAARMDLPVVVIGADCAVLGAAAVDPVGNPAYCAHGDPSSNAIVWSVQPERLLRPKS